MNVTQTLLTQTARAHRNLEPLATVATQVTDLRVVACSRCHPIKKVATTGNTHLRVKIRKATNCAILTITVAAKNTLATKSSRWQRLEATEYGAVAAVTTVASVV